MTSSLRDRTETLLERLEALRPLPGLLTLPSGGDLRDNLLLALRTKALPELRSGGKLPVFVAIQGGANVGKSTVFNALAGKILSPALIQASATKHPLVFLHESWRETFLPEGPFPDLECLLLEDPRDLTIRPERTDLLYLKFHSDDALREVALVDSPDFDGALASNLEVALTITALSDVTFFVTTSQKYRDRELVERLRSLVELKPRVILVFNRVTEEIVFRTLIDDLEEVLPLRDADVRTLRLVDSRRTHPEEEVRGGLLEIFGEELADLDVTVLKPRLVRKTLQRVIERLDDLRERHAPELELKQKLLEVLGQGIETECRRYDERFALAFPEETLAIRRILKVTEIGPKLHLPVEVEAGSHIFKLLAMSLGKLGETVRDGLVRATRAREGTLDDRPAIIEEYARHRDEADRESALRGAESLRLELETACRTHEPASPLARAVLEQFFTPGRIQAFPDEIRALHTEVLEARPVRDEDLLARIDERLVKRPALGSTLFAAAFAAKVGAGVGLAWVVPPDGLFSVLNWIVFAAGYLGAAYLVALLISFGVRRRVRFRQRRRESFRAVIERGLSTPLESILDELLDARALTALETATRELERDPGLDES